MRDDCFVARFPLLATRELGFGLPATLVCGVSTNAFVGFASRARLTLLERRSLDWAFAFEAFDRELPLGGREFALACALFGMGWTAALGFFLVEPFLGSVGLLPMVPHTAPTDCLCGNSDCELSCNVLYM